MAGAFGRNGSNLAQTANRAVAYVVAPGDIHQCFPSFSPSDCLSLLMFRELRTPAKDDATRDGTGTSFPRPAPDQFTLELSKAA